MKRWFGGMLLVSFIASLLAACSGQAPVNRLRLQLFGSAEEVAVYQELARQYQAAHPQTRIDIVSVPAQSDHLSRLSAAFTAGDPPEVFLVNYRNFAQFAASGKLAPVGPLMARDQLAEDDYYAVALDAFRVGGELQCLPQNVSSLVVYYNKSLFAQAGVPLPQAGWNHATFVRTAQQLSRDDNGDGILDIHGLGVDPDLVRLAPFIWQYGGELVDNSYRPTRVTLDDPRTMEGIQFFLDLSNIQRVVPTEPEVKAEDLESRFMHGKLGMLLQSRRVVPTFRTISAFDWDVAPLPAGPRGATTVLHSDAYCIAAGANSEAAWSFVRFAAGPEGQQIVASGGRSVPSLKAIAGSPTFLDPAQAPASSQVFLDAIATMRALPAVPAWPKVEKIVNKELELAFYANGEANEALGAPQGEEEGGLSPLALDIIMKGLRHAQAEATKALQE